MTTTSFPDIHSDIVFLRSYDFESLRERSPNTDAQYQTIMNTLLGHQKVLEAAIDRGQMISASRATLISTTAARLPALLTRPNTDLRRAVESTISTIEDQHARRAASTAEKTEAASLLVIVKKAIKLVPQYSGRASCISRCSMPSMPSGKTIKYAVAAGVGLALAGAAKVLSTLVHGQAGVIGGGTNSTGI